MFLGEVETKWLVKGRLMQLLDNFSFVDSAGKYWTAPAGLVTDGASIPQIFWSIAGGPFEGDYRRAAVLHDAGYKAREVERKLVDMMFYEAMLEDGVDRDQAARMYTAVRLFGPKWDTAAMKALAFLPPLPPDINQIAAAIDIALGE